MSVDTWSLGTPEELIHRKRRQVLVHSILYYVNDCPVIRDWEFDDLAKELAQLQKTHPIASSNVEYYKDAFKNFEGETGYHLPLNDLRAIRIAYRLWRVNNMKVRVNAL